MGMFDSVRCERELPGQPKPPTKAWLQTKDFCCALDTYTITADGKLIGPDGQVDFHGMMDFGAFEDDISYDYRAKFTDGQLVEITCERIEKFVAPGQPWQQLYPTAL